MPNITDTSNFINDLFIPLAKAQPSGSVSDSSPNNQDALINAITVVERSILINALGLTIYNELQTALLDIDNAAQKWQDLVKGVEYDDKVWSGLDNPQSLLLYAIYYSFLSDNSDFYTAVGVAKPQSENANNVTPFYKLSSANHNFINKYQTGCLEYPQVYKTYKGTFIDWVGASDNVDVSLYQFLQDKKDDYSFDASKFKTYRVQNSFGL